MSALAEIEAPVHTCVAVYRQRDDGQYLALTSTSRPSIAVVRVPVGTGLGDIQSALLRLKRALERGNYHIDLKRAADAGRGGRRRFQAPLQVARGHETAHALDVEAACALSARRRCGMKG